MKRPLVEIEWNGLSCVGRVIVGDWEGDTDVPNGTRTLPPYVDDLQVFAGPGEDDIVDYMTENACDLIIEKMLEYDDGEA